MKNYRRYIYIAILIVAVLTIRFFWGVQNDYNTFKNEMLIQSANIKLYNTKVVVSEYEINSMEDLRTIWEFVSISDAKYAKLEKIYDYRAEIVIKDENAGKIKLKLFWDENSEEVHFTFSTNKGVLKLANYHNKVLMDFVLKLIDQ